MGDDSFRTHTSNPLSRPAVDVSLHSESGVLVLHHNCNSRPAKRKTRGNGPEQYTASHKQHRWDGLHKNPHQRCPRNDGTMSAELYSGRLCARFWKSHQRSRGLVIERVLCPQVVAARMSRLQTRNRAVSFIDWGLSWTSKAVRAHLDRYQTFQAVRRVPSERILLDESENYKCVRWAATLPQSIQPRGVRDHLCLRLVVWESFNRSWHE